MTTNRASDGSNMDICQLLQGRKAEYLPKNDMCSLPFELLTQGIAPRIYQTFVPGRSSRDAGGKYSCQDLRADCDWTIMEAQPRKVHSLNAEYLAITLDPERTSDHSGLFGQVELLSERNGLLECRFPAA